MTEETWVDIEGWPYHQISNQGQVRVLPGGITPGPHIVTEIQIRKQTLNARGYMTIGQGNHSHYIHSLVLTAFVGKRPYGQECRHLNGNKTDNRIENLAWGTKRENIQDKTKHGTNGKKLMASDILDIRSRNDSSGKLAREYNVSRTTIKVIRNGSSWNI